jgi:hypothetical protein
MSQKFLPVQAPPRVLCPVCRQRAYSAAGIHPQCAALQSDPRRPVKRGFGSKPAVAPVKVGDESA